MTIIFKNKTERVVCVEISNTNEKIIKLYIGKRRDTLKQQLYLARSLFRYDI